MIYIIQKNRYKYGESMPPTPGTDKAGKCPAVAGGGGWAQVELTDT